MNDKSENKFEIWSYFSNRADQSANALRAILFASANAGILALTNASLKIILEDKFQLQLSILIAPILSFFCFIVSLCQIIASWQLQKNKSIERRKKIELEFGGFYKEFLGKEVMHSSHQEKDTSQERNEHLDNEAIQFLLMAYILFVVAIIVFASTKCTS